MDQSSLPPGFERTSVYQLASTWLNPRDDPEALAWLLTLNSAWQPSARCGDGARRA